jgi:hypothetical protein
LRDAFERAGEGTGLVERDLEVAGRGIRLRFAGDELWPLMLPPIEHLTTGGAGEPSTSICLWDSASTGVRIPDFPWSGLDVRQQGLIAGYNGERFRTVYHGDILDPPHYGFNALSMFDTEAGVGLFWVSSLERVPWYEPVEPLRPTLHWALARHGHHMVHAATVATEHGAVLIAGKGWSGKSTTALACVEAGFGFLGDNYVVLSTAGDAPMAHTLFANAKLRPGTLELLPELASVASPGGEAEDAKLIVDFRSYRHDQVRSSAPVKAVLVPELTGEGDTTVEPASARAGLMALAPSTIYQLPNNGGAGLRPMAELVRRVPTFALKLGADPRSAPPAIARLLEELR